MTERRRFPRIQLETVNLSNLALSQAVITGFKVAGKTQQACQLRVYDISFLGVAIDEIEGLQKGELVEIELRLGAGPSMAAQGLVVRAEDKKMGLQLMDLSSELHLAIDRFLQDKLVGQQTKLVTRQYYNPNEGFDYWFHGPKSTNLILWMSQGRLEKAFFENDEDVLVFENNELSYRKAGQELKTRSFQYEYDIELSLEPNESVRPPASVLSKFLQIIGQIEDPSSVTAPLRLVLEQQA